MRQGQNKRMRGRNNNNNGGPNRKGPNPLTRSYESNGPDVKIRGTAHHVAEKYLQLARDAQTSGDPVMAENYLQHAEHYFRLIASAQLAQQQAQVGYQRPAGEADAEEDDDDDDMGGLPDRFASPQERQPAVVPAVAAPQPNFYNGQPQPFQERPPYNNAERNEPRSDNRQEQPRQDSRNVRPDRNFNERKPYQDRNSYQDRSIQPERPNQERYNNDRQNNQNRNQDQQRRPRDVRNDAPRNDAPRSEQPRFEPARTDQVRFEVSRAEVASVEPVRAEMPRPAPTFDPGPSLPAFITAPVRIAAEPVVSPEMSETAGEDGAARPRRRRRTRAEIDSDNAREAAGKATAGE